MKLFTTGALILATATAASAMTNDTDVAKIQNFVPGADVQSLSDAEVASLLSVIHSGDSPAVVRGKILANLN